MVLVNSFISRCFNSQIMFFDKYISKSLFFKTNERRPKESHCMSDVAKQTVLQLASFNSIKQN